MYRNVPLGSCIMLYCYDFLLYSFVLIGRWKCAFLDISGSFSGSENRNTYFCFFRDSSSAFENKGKRPTF